MDLALLLAVACTLEIDFGPTPQQSQWERECQIMWSQMDAASVERGQPLDQVVWRYVAGLACEGKRCDTPRARMYRSLNEAGGEPEGWDPQAGAWNKHYRWRWVLRLEHARRFVDAVEHRPMFHHWRDARLFFPSGSSASCRASRHFGGACSVTGACDAVPACWTLANCGQTQQAYWVPKTCTAGAGTIDAKTASARK